MNYNYEEPILEDNLDMQIIDIPVRFYYSTRYTFTQLDNYLNGNQNLDIYYYDNFDISNDISYENRTDLNHIYFPSVNLINRLFQDYIENKNKLNEDEYNNSIEKINKKIDECPVCFNSNDKTVIIKKCKHNFCENCIENWLKNHKSTCPICRTSVNSNNSDYSKDEELESNEYMV